MKHMDLPPLLLKTLPYDSKTMRKAQVFKNKRAEEMTEKKDVNKKLKAGNCTNSCCLTRLETAEKKRLQRGKVAGGKYICGAERLRTGGHDEALNEWFTVFTGSYTPRSLCGMHS